MLAALGVLCRPEGVGDWPNNRDSGAAAERTKGKRKTRREGDGKVNGERRGGRRCKREEGEDA